MRDITDYCCNLQIISPPRRKLVCKRSSVCLSTSVWVLTARIRCWSMTARLISVFIPDSNGPWDEHWYLIWFVVSNFNVTVNHDSFQLTNYHCRPFSSWILNLTLIIIISQVKERMIRQLGFNLIRIPYWVMNPFDQAQHYNGDGEISETAVAALFEFVEASARRIWIWRIWELRLR